MLRKLSVASDAHDALYRAVELEPNKVAPRHALMTYYLVAPMIAGGSRARAQQQSEQIAKIDAAAGHAAHARILLHDGDDQAALSAYRRAFELRPDRSAYRLQVGLLLQSFEHWGLAFAHFTDWSNADPGATAAWYQLGRTAVLSAERTDMGIAALQRFLALPEDVNDPHPTDAWFRLGQAYEQAGELIKSRHAHERALGLDPDNSAAAEAMANLPAQ